MSPNTTPVMDWVAFVAQPVHCDVMVYSTGAPPFVAAVGSRRAFQVSSGLFQGFQPRMSYGGQTSFGQGRAPNAPPKAWWVAVVETTASTV